MLAYHMGWVGENAGGKAHGKRIRPVLVLLTTAACGVDWHKAIPAASAVELVHNFSLIHDDIEDNSPTRRGRETVWHRWGVPQAINAGDALFTIAHLAMHRLAGSSSPETTLRAMQIFDTTCYELTRGQYLDMAYETSGEISLDAYLPMITGKTAALVSACTQIGAVIASAPETIENHYFEFGKNLGLAFQAIDDLLGIWGDSGKTGKSNVDDIISGKKTLPILYGLENSKPFRDRWMKGTISTEEVPDIANTLKQAGAHDYAQSVAEGFSHKAIQHLELASPQGKAAEALLELTSYLLKRDI